MMGHYASEMPEIERGYSSASSAQLRDWVETTVDVLKDHGRPMKQAELERVAARVLGISVVRMPYVIANAVADHRIKRGGLGRYDVLELA